MISLNIFWSKLRFVAAYYRWKIGGLKGSVCVVLNNSYSKNLENPEFTHDIFRQYLEEPYNIAENAFLQ